MHKTMTTMSVEQCAQLLREHCPDGDDAELVGYLAQRMMDVCDEFGPSRLHKYLADDLYEHGLVGSLKEAVRALKSIGRLLKQMALDAQKEEEDRGHSISVGNVVEVRELEQRGLVRAVNPTGDSIRVEVPGMGLRWVPCSEVQLLKLEAEDVLQLEKQLMEMRLRETGPLSHKEQMRIEGKTAVSKMHQADEKRRVKREARREAKQNEIAKAKLEQIRLLRDQVDDSEIDSGARRAAANGSNDVVIPDFSLPPLGGGAELLTSTSLKLAYGRKYGLVGRNGVGKSTLLKAISQKRIKGLSRQLGVALVQQEIEGSDLSVLDAVLAADVERAELLKEEADLNEKAQTDPAVAAQRLPQVYARLKEIDAWTAEARAADILSGLQFTAEMQTLPTKSLSGGWRMRVALAAGLFTCPSLLLLDEPTNHLDFPAVLWLENYLRDYSSAVLLVSHDRYFVNNVVDEVIHFYDRTLTYYKGDYDTFEKTRGERLRQQQKAFDSQERKRKHVQQFIDKFRFNAKRASLVQSRIKALDRMALLDDVTEDPTFRLVFPVVDMLGHPVIQMDNVSFGYKPDKLLLSNINIRLDQNSRVCMVGKNGAGKSTLLNLMSGTLEALDGTCWRNGNARIEVFTQHHIEQLDMTLSPLEYLMKCFPKCENQQMRNHLGQFGVSGDLALQLIGTLSGGQKSRVAFAKMFYPKPHFVILDEITNHLDHETIEALLIALSTYNGGAVMVSHDQHFALNAATEFWSLENGTLTTFDTFEEARKHTFSTLGARKRKA